MSELAETHHAACASALAAVEARLNELGVVVVMPPRPARRDPHAWYLRALAATVHDCADPEAQHALATLSACWWTLALHDAGLLRRLVPSSLATDDRDDAAQVVRLGAYRASQTWRPDRAPWTPYVSQWARSFLTRWREDERSLVRLSSHLHVDRSRLETAMRTSPSTSPVVAGQGIGLSPARVRAVLTAPRVGPLTFDPASAESSVTTADLAPALAALPPRLHQLVRARFGLDDSPPLSLKTLASALGVSRRRVALDVAAALRLLGAQLADR